MTTPAPVLDVEFVARRMKRSGRTKRTIREQWFPSSIDEAVSIVLADRDVFEPTSDGDRNATFWEVWSATETGGFFRLYGSLGLVGALNVTLVDIIEQLRSKPVRKKKAAA